MDPLPRFKIQLQRYVSREPRSADETRKPWLFRDVDLPTLWEKSENYHKLMDNDFDLTMMQKSRKRCSTTSKETKQLKSLAPQSKDNNGFVVCQNCNTVITRVFSPQIATFINVHDRLPLPPDVKTLHKELQKSSIFADFDCERYLKIHLPEHYHRMWDVKDIVENLAFWSSTAPHPHTVPPNCYIPDFKLRLLFCCECMSGPIGTFDMNYRSCFIAINDCIRLSQDWA